MDKAAVKFSIPEGVQFAELKLSRDANGIIRFQWEPIDTICAANGVNLDIFKASTEDNVAGFIVEWYQAHIANGGDPDPVAEDLIAETKLEDERGGGFSLPPGRA